MEGKERKKKEKESSYNNLRWIWHQIVQAAWNCEFEIKSNLKRRLEVQTYIVKESKLF